VKSDFWEDELQGGAVGRDNYDLVEGKVAGSEGVLYPYLNV
jgi:hypothetical protein